MQAKNKSKKLLIIIVNWNTKALLNDCLKSIESTEKAVELEVAIIDNASSDGSTKMLRENFSKYHLILNDINLGFGSACNQAIKKFSDFQYYLFLNSDASLNKVTLKEMLRVLDSEKNIAAVNPALQLLNGALQCGGAGYGPSWVASFNTFFFLSKMSPLFKGIYFHQKHYRAKKEIINVNWLAFACTLFRKSAFDNVGLLDEKYFVYGEDSDWCWQARKKGWKFGYLPYVNIIHHVGGSSQSKAQLDPKWFINLSISIKSQGNFLDYYLFLIFAVLGYFIRYTLLYFGNFIVNNKYVVSKRMMWILLKCSFCLLFGLNT